MIDPRKWAARNPLGIIALFIFLIYGMTAIVLGWSAEVLALDNQTRLVWFMVIFPVIVLIVFFWLVTRHHTKLYGPGDFRSDDSFLRGVGSAPPKALGERLEKEVAEASEERDTSEQTAEVSEEQEKPEQDATSRDNAHDPAPTKGRGRANASATRYGSGNHRESQRVSRDATTGRFLQRSRAVSEAFLTEGLVFQQLQEELEGSVRRQVRYQTEDFSMIFDGFIETKDGKRVFVEVKNAPKSHTIAKRIVQRFNDQLSHFEKVAGYSVLFVLVFPSVQDRYDSFQMLDLGHAQGDKFTLRIMYRDELLAQYGLS